MAFINYHGEKEDRYSEVLEYSRAQQKEEWKKNEADRIGQWLADIGSDSKLSQKNIQELLKLVILCYKSCEEKYKPLVASDKFPDKCDKSRLWNDFAIDISDRHIQAFHVSQELREKHLQTFIDRIFKLQDCVSAETHITALASENGYRKYYTESFDLTWTGRLFYYLLQYVGNPNEVDAFFDEYKKLSIALSLYFYQAFHPRDDGWMSQIESERNALETLKKQTRVNKHVEVNLGVLQNPKYQIVVEPAAVSVEAEKITADSQDIPGFDKSGFYSLLEKQDLPSFVLAGEMLLKCDLPDEIADNYGRIIERMPVLQDAINKFDDVYHADIDLFTEYYAPEAFRITATLLEYEAVKPSEKIIEETRENVIQATRKLILVVDEKIDEIYKFVTIETNAEARALEAMMSQDGYVDSNLKIR